MRPSLKFLRFQFRFALILTWISFAVLLKKPLANMILQNISFILYVPHTLLH